MSEKKQQYAIAEFFHRERSNLIGFVRRLIEDTAERDGEDIVQDVALNLFHSADIALPIENLAAYVYRALRNRVIDLLRQRKEETVSLDTSFGDDSRLKLSDILRDAHEDAANKIERQELQQRLFDAIDALPTSQKAVIVETEFEGRSFRELSEMWNVPVGTLLARKSRGLKAIRKTIDEIN